MMKYNTKCNVRQPRLVSYLLSFTDQKCQKALFPVAKKKTELYLLQQYARQNHPGTDDPEHK